MAESYVVDTSAFLTDEIRDKDESIQDVLERFIDLFQNCPEDTEFYMPNTIYKELEEIIEQNVEGEFLSDLKVSVKIQSPSRHEISIPGDVLYSFIGEMRERTNKGLRAAEKSVKELGEMDEEPEKKYYEKEDVVISDLRDKFKEKMRKGVIDSEEDLDLILLAREKNAILVTEDKGVLNWADELGIERLEGKDFPSVLKKRIT